MSDPRQHDCSATGLTAILAVALLVGCAEPEVSTITYVDQDDPEMAVAIKTARETVDQFLSRWETSGDEFSGFLKVEFEYPDDPDNGEHMWVELQEKKGGQFRGILMSSPEHVEGLKTGQMVEFGQEDISDWLYVENGRAVGAFTVRVIRSRMTEEERKINDSLYDYSFDE